MSAPAPSEDASPLADRHARWLDETGVLLTERERVEFLALGESYRRDAFVESFWISRDPHPETARNELRDTWEERLAAAREQFGTVRDVRAQVYLLTGEPASRERPDCPELLPLEVWRLADSLPSPAGDGTVVFVKPSQGSGAYRAWTPDEGLAVLGGDGGPPDTARLRKRCDDGADLLRSLELAVPPVRLRDLAVSAGDDGWLDAFLARSTSIAPDARALDARLDIAYPDRAGSRTVVEMTVAVPREALGEAGRPESFRFVVDGEILQRDKLLDTFHYRFETPSALEPTEPIPLVLQRHLRPGAYALRLRVESVDLQSYYRETRDLQVPVLAAAAGETADGGPTITLERPPRGLHTGRLRVRASSTGDTVAAVAFELNGRAGMTKRRPPWSIEIDLGRAPRVHELRAVALDAGGRTLATDEILVNAGPQNFAVRLVEPQPGTRHSGSVRARAIVDVPRGAQLDRVEFYLNEDRLSTHFQPPFAQALRLPTDLGTAYVRAVAYLDDGHSTESLVFVNSPSHLDRLDVDLVELYASVVDRKGRPVDGLGRSDFEIYEEQVPQRIRRFERASDLPFHAAVVIDTSTSMADEMRQAERAALAFFRSVVTPRDRASVVTFADEPRLVVPFTGDLEVLAGGLADIVADGETALHDSIVFTLYHFGGLRGQRALILLSDGEDSTSSYSFEEALEFAREMGVAIFAIALDVPSRAFEARAKLMRLSSETGGRHFFIHRTSELERVYRTIEDELRSRYLIAYQSSLDGEDFRHVDVRLADPALRAKTIAGYKP